MKSIIFALTVFCTVPMKHFCQIESDNKVDSIIKPWLGKPYRYGGTTKRGIDCSAFTQKIWKELGVLIPRTARSQYQAADKIDTCDMQVGDLLFFMSRQSPSGWHVAFYLGNNKFVHAANRRMGVIVQDLTTEVRARLFSIGRFTKKKD